ncbi:MAG TPA: ATP-binding protein, partial [Candidatus Saccharimonadales bacterium]|nr:ATP-binding protein [Candidatus Saccharimonadales bacterium]
MVNVLITIFIILVIGIAVAVFVFSQYQKTLRDAKNYERGLKMIPMHIHIPPSGEDLESNGRDERDITEEALSQAQVMYNIISSTATRGFKSRIYGQRHISFEVIAHEGLVYYYVIVPAVLTDIIIQAVAAA